MSSIFNTDIKLRVEKSSMSKSMRNSVVSFVVYILHSATRFFILSALINVERKELFAFIEFDLALQQYLKYPVFLCNALVENDSDSATAFRVI